MSHCILTAELGGEERQFALYLGQWEELQEITGCGPFILFQKLGTWDIRAKWLREIIRLGLIGGGMAPAQAKRMVERYVDSVPFSESLPLAIKIVGPACFPPSSEIDSKKKEETEAEDPTASSFPRSTGTVQ
jgi:hypothetical protein